jgi:hypothetical protein
MTESTHCKVRINQRNDPNENEVVEERPMKLMAAEVIFAEKAILPIHIRQDRSDGNEQNDIPPPKEKSSN